MKPFKPPTLVKKTPSQSVPVSIGPPAKRRRLSRDDVDNVTHVEATMTPADSLSATMGNACRGLSDVAGNTGPCHQGQIASQNPPASYYSVLWRKFTNKKNKTWEGDAILCIMGSEAQLQDVSGRVLGRGICRATLSPGSELSIGGREIEVDAVITKRDVSADVGDLKDRPDIAVNRVNRPGHTARNGLSIHDRLSRNPKERSFRVLPRKKDATHAFKTPLPDGSQQAQQKSNKVPVPRHDPDASGALVMKRPKCAPNGRQIVDVVVDPALTRALRPHQREGVSFLYECVMGMRGYTGEGAILADEMGLGKTLQTIALLWTLLKQNPIYEAGPVVKRVLIVCPATLINNWRKEIRKWLGFANVGIFVAENKNARLTDFTMGKAYQIMIIGYEKLTKIQDQLRKGHGIDIVVADEGHRLKTEKNKAALAIKSLNTERRIILSGTPLQNELAELYTMVEFVNPGVFNKYTAFRRDFETPIMKSRQPGASQADLEKGEASSRELASITEQFILRRTANILKDYLPAKTEYVVFCRPTGAQAALYRAIVGSPVYRAALGSSAIFLELINVLKKVCNSPRLLQAKSGKDAATARSELLESIAPRLASIGIASGKMDILVALLRQISTTTEEKVVLVSNYTSTLDLLQGVLVANSWKYLRLDGSTPSAARQDLVDRFNRSPPSNSFVFLLSSKAGGVGINLIGASRLILFDLDWNPATDLQAMARVHRDGQKRPCVIYRFLMQGGLDEKIFQRQVSKTGLADSIVDGKAAMSGFTREELRDLFSLDEGKGCQTHELMGCRCGGGGGGGGGGEVLMNPVNCSTDDTVLDDGGNDDAGDIERRWSSPSLMTALKCNDIVTPDVEQSRQGRPCQDSTGQSKMLSLMQYTHFDTARSSEAVSGSEEVDSGVAVPLIDTAIEDQVLRSVIHDTGLKIGYVFAKTRGLSTASAPEL